jgi:predicted nucleic acid-binding protein
VSAEDIPVVVDTNILFSALLRPDSKFVAALAGARRFYISEIILTEIFRHKEKILATTRLGEPDLTQAYHVLLTCLELYKEAMIPPACWKQAEELCRDVDPEDKTHVALTLALDGLLWTGDKALKAGLMAKGFDRFFNP